jgi:hypothetical protein
MTALLLLEIEFSQWRALLRDLALARPVHAFAGYLVQPPVAAAPAPDFIPVQYNKELS